MPQILDLGEHGIHEVPDDLTPDEIQGFADSFSPAPFPKSLSSSSPEWADMSAKMARDEQYRRAASEMLDPGTGLTKAIFHDAPAAMGTVLQDAGTAIYEGGVNAIANRLPEFYNDPNEIAQSYDTETAIRSYPKPVQAFIRGGEGLAKSLPQLGIAMVNPLAGAMAFGMTPEGFDHKAFAIAAALPFAGAKIGKVTEAIAGRAGVTSGQALEAINRIGGVTGAAGLIAADEAQRIAQIEDPKEREDALIAAFGNVGSQFLLGGIGPIERGSKVGKASETLGKFAESIDTAPIEGKLSPQDAAEVRLGLPTRAATPEMLPELQRTKELVDQAIQEATQKIKVPGQVSALELLKRQTLNLEEAPARVAKPETGFERPAEEVMRGRTVAEKPLEPAPVVKEEAPAVVDKAEGVKPGNVRLYHGSSGDAVGFDFTPDLEYARGYASKSGGKSGKIWYVDVPENSPFLRRDEGANNVLINRQVLPNDVVSSANFLEQSKFTESPPVKEAQHQPVSDFINEFKKKDSKISNASDKPDAITTQKVGLSLKNISELDDVFNAHQEALKRLEELKAKSRSGDKLTQDEFNEYATLAAKIQFPREVVETATNSGSWAEGGKTSIGERPLDWKKNPEVKDWLTKNGEKIGIKIEAEKVAEVPKVESGIKELIKLTGEDATDPRMSEVGITKAGKPNEIVVEIRDLQSIPIKEIYIKPSGDPINDAAVVVKRIKSESSENNRVSIRESSGTLLDGRGHGVTRFTNTPNGPAWASVNDLIQARKQKAVKPAEVGDWTADESSGKERSDYISKTESLSKEYPDQPNSRLYVKKVYWSESELGGRGAWRVDIVKDGKLLKGEGGASFAEAGNNPDYAAAKAMVVELAAMQKDAPLMDLLNKLSRIPQSDRQTFKLSSNRAEDAFQQFGGSKGKPTEISVPKDSALGKAIKAIEDAQAKLRKSSSEGGLQMGVPKAILDVGLETVRLALKAGKSISEAVEVGIKKIYDSLDEVARKTFDENALRKQLNSTIGVQSPEGMKPRSFSERAAKSEMVPEDVQTQIKTEERSSYEPQKVADVQERVDKMTDAELGSLTPQSEDYTLGKAALANRLFKSGNKAAGLDVIQEASETLTRLGQLINQAKILNAVKPEYVADVVNSKLEKMGKDPLRPEVAEKITKLSEAKVKAGDELEVAINEWKNKPTDENAKIAQDKLNASEKAQLDLQEETLKWTSNRSIWKKLKKILQGNLLTPVSQIVNATSYFGLNPFEAAARTGATAIDILENKMLGTPRVSSVSPIGGTIEAIKGLGRGAAKIPGIMMKGSSGVVLGESSVSMNPLKAWMRQFASQPDIPTEGGKLTLKDRADLLLEGTFGMPAEVMLRGLGALDSAVKESQRARIIAEQLRLKKVPQNQWDTAMKFPEKFFDRKTMDYIESEASSAVLQRDSKSINTLNSFLNQQHPAVDFAVATVAPYKLTPWNYLGKLFSYNPAIAIGRGLYEASKGNRKQANEYAARALIGSTVATAAYYLYKYGMVSPSLDKSDEQQKARVLTGEVMPPNHVNISALKRVMATLAKGEKPTREDYDFRKGDETKNSFRLGGITGGMIYMMANIGRAQERKPETGNAEFFQQAFKQSTLEQANFALNQSFLSGVEGLLTAVKQGDENDSYLKQYSKTLLSIPLPNTLSSVGRSMREYKPDFNADTIGKKIENVVRERLSAFGTTEGLPIKRDLWGEPMRETPKDANPLVYHLFSITKGQQVTDDPKALELFRLWRATDNSRIIPTPPKQAFDYQGESYQVPANLMERYTELVGKERAAIVEKFVTNPNWNKLNNDEKVDELEWAYKKGMKYGKDQFWDEHEKELKKKPMKTGFQLP